MDVILEQYPDAKIIEVIRDGRDVCVSWHALAQSRRWARKSTPELISQWQRCIRLGETFRARPELQPRIFPVRYEQLRQAPTTYLSQVFDFAELDYDPALVDRIVEAHDINRVIRKGPGQMIRKGAIGDWRTHLSEADQDLWRRQAGEMLVGLGYGW
jgi:hypothetical protein